MVTLERSQVPQVEDGAQIDVEPFGALSRTSLDAITRAGEAVQVFAPVPKMAWS